MPREKAVCDASVAINFAKIRRLDLLLESFEKPILIPREVFAEAVVRGLEKKEPDAVIIQGAIRKGLVMVRNARKQYTHPYLDAGEKAAISLALQEEVGTVCFDEAPARNAAKQAGLKPIGSLGILFRAIRAGKITAGEANGLLDQMIKRDYRISAGILQKFKSALINLR